MAYDSQELKAWKSVTDTRKCSPTAPVGPSVAPSDRGAETAAIIAERTLQLGTYLWVIFSKIGDSQAIRMPPQASPDLTNLHQPLPTPSLPPHPCIRSSHPKPRNTSRNEQSITSQELELQVHGRHVL